MGEEMNLQVERNTKVFNTPIEIGLRLLFILNRFAPQALTVEMLIYLDYFLIHSGDIKNGPSSLHPKYPFRSAEIIIKRELVQKGLYYLQSKQLVEIEFSEKGLFYRASNLGSQVLTLFESGYSTRLQEMSRWLYQEFANTEEEKLKTMIEVNLQKWGGEFVNEAKFRNS
jgi:hypothetical protein